MAVRSPSAYEKSIFINCPFDRDYQDLMLAIVFSVAAHRLLPRSARETEGDPEPRFSRILGAIAGSKYSIHDLSRSTGEDSGNLARFNMPLELGMAAAFRFEREGSRRPHRWLALVPDGYAYQSFISDLAGFDPGRHDSSVHPLSARCLPGSGRKKTSLTRCRHLCRSFRALHITDVSSSICRRRHSISKLGPMLYRRRLEPFRVRNCQSAANRFSTDALSPNVRLTCAYRSTLPGPKTKLPPS